MYSKIDARFWDDEKVLTLSPDARYLLVYLLTTKHRNVLGCYQLPRAYALEDTRLPEKRFSHAWRELFGSGIVTYEDNTRMVLLKNFLRYNPIENPNQVKGALSRLEGLPRSDLFLTVYKYLEAQMRQGGKQYLQPLLEALPKLFTKPFPNPLETFPETVTETLSEPLPEPDNSKQITVTVTESSKQNEVLPPIPPEGIEGEPPATPPELLEPDFVEDETPKPRRRKPSTLTKTQEARFNRFWDVYPRKVSLGDAEKAWAKIDPDEELLETIIDAVETAKRLDSRFREVRFTPHPASWLNAKSWANQYDGPEDSPPQPPRGPAGKPDTLGVLAAMLEEEGGDTF